MIHSIFSTEVIQKCTEISIQAQYSDYCNTQLGHSTNGIPISSLQYCTPSQCWHAQSPERNRYDEASTSPLLSSKLLPVIQFLYSVLAQATYSYPHAGLANSGKHSHSFNELREKHLFHQLIHSAVNICLSKINVTLCVNINSASLQQMWSVTKSSFKIDI